MLHNEKDIISNWENNSSEPIVSILCMTFNQKDFIEDTIIGFLNQRTSFPFEIIIHDDSYNDGTAEIVHRYQKLFPRLIKPIFQRENQYSQGIEILTTYLVPKAKGTYYAFCAGDDF